MYFSFFLVTLASCTPVLWPFLLWHTLYFIFLYMMMIFVHFLHLSLRMLFLFYLNTCFFMYTIFISISHIIPWWVLFKCFRKTGCESLSCHKLSSCKVFQEFVVWIDLFCNTTSGYELSDLILLSWLFVLLRFSYGLSKGEIVRVIFFCNWLIFWQNTLYL